MSTTVQTRLTGPARRQRQLSPDECHAWLAGHHEGRLGYLTGRGPRRLAVRYATSAGQLVFRLPDYNDAVHYLPDDEVSLEVEGWSGTGGFETVTVVGTARRAVDDAAADDHVQLDEAWPAGVVTTVIHLPITTVSGVVTESTPTRAKAALP